MPIDVNAVDAVRLVRWDEPVGQRWGNVEPALKEAKVFSFTHRTKVFADSTTRKNRCVTSGELAQVRGWHRDKRAYKREAKGRARLGQ